jgi:molecular chaperone GrpE
MTTEPEPTIKIELEEEEAPPEEPKAPEVPTEPLDIPLSTEENKAFLVDPRLAEFDVLKAENSKLKDQALRALAEADNARKRAERDREEASKYAIANFARGLLTVADNLRRALAAVPDDLKANDTRIAALIGGIEATERDLLAGFDRVGIKKISALDQPFNAHQHEVILEAPGTGKPPGTVVQVVEDGYMIHDRLLRPARVGVAKADLDSPPTAHTFDEKV